MKRTRKWAFIGQEAQRLIALGMSPAEVSRQIGVQKSTVTRWLQSGKLTRSSPRRLRPAARGADPKAPAAWAASVREDYALDATDEQLVTSAQQALEVAYNMAEPPTTRLNAMGRFQSLVKQLSLGLSDRKSATPEAPEPSAPRPTLPRQVPARGPGDPRVLLQAVK